MFCIVNTNILKLCRQRKLFSYFNHITNEVRQIEAVFPGGATLYRVNIIHFARKHLSACRKSSLLEVLVAVDGKPSASSCEAERIPSHGECPHWAASWQRLSPHANFRQASLSSLFNRNWSLDPPFLSLHSPVLARIHHP